MKWGIVFSIPATHKDDLWGLPPPSLIEEYQRWDNTKSIRIVYHFKHNPQNWKEWQRVAAIKVQIDTKFKGITFKDYESVDCPGPIYTISELGRHFKERIDFTKPYVNGTPYKILCRHGKRLYYEHKLYFEQLMAVSLWLSTLNDIGQHRRPSQEAVRQCMKRAYAAYNFSLDHLDEWKQKLNDKERHILLSKAGRKSATVRRTNSRLKRLEARRMRRKGKKNADIADALKVSIRTIIRWCK